MRDECTGNSPLRKNKKFIEKKFLLFYKLISHKTGWKGEIMDKNKYKYHHIGIPTKNSFKGEKYLKDYKFYHSGYENSEFGIEWMRFEEDCELSDIVKTLPHVAFEVEDIFEAIKGKKVIIEPNSPSEDVIVAFIEENGAPIEFIQVKKK